MNKTNKQEEKKKIQINKEKVTKIALTAGGALGLVGIGYFLGTHFSDSARPIRHGYVGVAYDHSDKSWNFLLYRNKRRYENGKPSRHTYITNPEVLSPILNDSMEILKKMKGEE